MGKHREIIKQMPDAQPERGYIDQIRWERDIAIQQLKELGYSLGEKPRTQPDIIRCKDCKRYDGRPCGIVDWYNTADDFCSRAEKRSR